MARIVKPRVKVIMNDSLATSTKNCYSSKIKALVSEMDNDEKGEYISESDSQLMLKKSIPKELLISLIDDKCNDEEVLNEDGSVKSKEKPKSASTFGSYVSAFKNWVTESNRMRPAGADAIRFDEDSEIEVRTYGRGLRRKIAQIRQNGEAGEVTNNAKCALSFSGYQLLAKYALFKARSSKQACLVHPYLVLCWNLMARSNGVSNLLWDNIGWNGDCLTVLYERSKTNQEGEKMVPRHLYANPHNPEVCPILALGLKLVSEEDSGDSQNARFVFKASTSESSFGIWLKEILESLSELDQALLVVPSDKVGSHSLRKGSATYALGITDGPDSDNIKLRMEHSLGGTDDRYLFRQAGSDKYVGRVASGLDLNSPDFASLPPHFKTPVDVNEVIPAQLLSKANNSLKSAFPYLVASVVYHWDWLVTNLPKNHPFFTSALYTGRFKDEWRPLVVTGIFKNEETGMRASGIPQLVTVLFNQLNVLSAVNAIPDRLMEKISSVGGVQLHNAEIIERAIGPRLSAIENVLNRGLATHPAPAVNAQIRAFRTYIWGGEIHPCPENFVFPKETARKVWRLWLFGNEQEVNTPYRSITGRSLAKNQAAQLSRARVFFDTVRTKIALSYEEISGLVQGEVMAKFDEAYSELMAGVPKKDSMTLSNAYKHLAKKLSRDQRKRARVNTGIQRRAAERARRRQ